MFWLPFFKNSLVVSEVEIGLKFQEELMAYTGTDD